jgi:hypothetical protein
MLNLKIYPPPPNIHDEYKKTIVICTRIDSDDAISNDYSPTIASICVSLIYQGYLNGIVSFPHGIQYFDNYNLYGPFISNSNHFLNSYHTQKITNLNRLHCYSINHAKIFTSYNDNIFLINTQYPMWLETIHETNQMNMLRTYGLINTDSKDIPNVGLFDLLTKRFLIETAGIAFIEQKELPLPVLLEQRKLTRMNVKVARTKKELTKYKNMLIQSQKELTKYENMLTLSQKQLKDNSMMYIKKIKKIKNYYDTMVTVGKFDISMRKENIFPSSRQKFLISLSKPFIKIFAKPEYYIKLCLDPSDVFAVTQNPIMKLLKLLLNKLGPTPRKTNYKTIYLDLHDYKSFNSPPPTV